MTKNKQAFTLIELLVVVLIIGILAAVALPQYQTVVDKARFTQTITTGDALWKSAQRYVLANGEAPTTLDVLDIGVPGELVENNTSISLTGKYKCSLQTGGTDGIQKEIYCLTHNSEVSYRAIYAPQNLIKRMCQAAETDEKANKFCMKIGGVYYRATGTGFNLYKL